MSLPGSNLHVERVRYQLTEQQLAVMCVQQAQLAEKVERLELEKKTAIDNFKALISKEIEEIKKLNERAKRGFDEEEVPCDVYLNYAGTIPTPGMKTLVDARSGRQIAIVPMTEEDRQRGLFEADKTPPPDIDNAD